jgi:hypothetical protein
MKWFETGWENIGALGWNCPDSLRGLCGRGSAALETALVAFLFGLWIVWGRIRGWIGASI